MRWPCCGIAPRPGKLWSPYKDVLGDHNVIRRCLDEEEVALGEGL